MIIHDFDNVTEPLINLEHFYGKKKDIAEKCLIIFSKAIFDWMLANHDCRVIGVLGACNGDIEVYAFDLEGQTVAFYLTAIGSAAASGMCYEAHWVTGARKFVMFGSCGSLDEGKTRGRYVVPTECYRGEGASYYYAEPSDYLPVRNCGKVAAVFEEIGAPYVCGRVWTTDSMLRETVGLVKRRRDEGCVAVDMELAGVEALCDFYGLELYDFLEAGDVLADSGYDPGGLGHANHDLGKLRLAMEIAKRI